MQQIFINGNPSSLFFSDSATFDDIFEWVQEQVMFNRSNTFNLREQHSCSVSNSLNGSMIISGDEDRIEIRIMSIIPII